MINKCDLFKIGKLNKPHGVDGHITIVFTNGVFENNESDFLFFDIDGIYVPFYVEDYRFKSTYSAIIKFEGIDDIKTAKRFQGSEVYMERSAITEGQESISQEDFTDYDVYDTCHGYIGKATGIDTQTENILLFVEDSNGKEIIIPLHDDLISDIDDSRHSITFNLPNGMIDIDKAETITDN